MLTIFVFDIFDMQLISLRVDYVQPKRRDAET